MVRKDKFFFLLIFLLFILLAGRLFYLQILKGNFYRECSEHNRIQILKEFAPRGTIYDRSLDILVSNRASFCISLIPWLAGQRVDEVLTRLASILPINLQEIKSKIEAQKFRPFQPILLKEDASPSIVSRLQESHMDFPGIVVQIKPCRYYPHGRMCAHILGYIQEIQEYDLERFEEQGYEQGDLIGQTGIERAYESYLRGVDGGTEIEVDVLGRPGQPPHILAQKEPRQGAKVVLTIDREIQEACEKALGNRPGAIVVMNPLNGEILAMSSGPDFDPNMFTTGIPAQRWKELAAHPRKPFMNRAIQGLYPPGSAFKFVTAVAALEREVVQPQELFKCEGKISVGGREYKCWNRAGHGWVNFERAMAESCDIYFYHIGTMAGPEAISEYAYLFGFGAPAGIDIPGEKKGVVPGPEWKRKRGGKWYRGDTFNFSIGQGYLLITPLQLANAMCAFYNGGRLYRPHLVKEILLYNGERKKFSPEVIRDFSLKSSTVFFLENALRAVVTRGTGVLSNIPEAEVFGKTGTAQNPGGQDHAWFVCYARPVEGRARKGTVPVVVVVFIEGGGSGGESACPVARYVLHKIYSVEPAAPSYPSGISGGIGVRSTTLAESLSRNTYTETGLSTQEETDGF